jgi:hypothetical protein
MQTSVRVFVRKISFHIEFSPGGCYNKREFNISGVLDESG